MPDEISPIWMAACAHRLQQHWRRVDPAELELVAAEIWACPALRAMAPDAAAAEWLKPIEAGFSPLSVVKISCREQPRSDPIAEFAPLDAMNTNLDDLKSHGL